MGKYLINRKHFPCFYRVIETRVEVWEKREIAWEHEHDVRVFPRNITQFRPINTRVFKRLFYKNILAPPSGYYISKNLGVTLHQNHRDRKDSCCRGKFEFFLAATGQV